MRVALVNPNRYVEPPVIPVGVEYLAHYLEREGHEVGVIDLTFADDPEAALGEALQGFDPHVAGFSLRNVDTSLYFDNAFLLDTSAALIAACRRECEAMVVVGGSALLAGPREVMEYVDGDYAVHGPGERALPALLRDLERGASPPRLLDGWSHSFDAAEVPARGRWVDYAPYLAGRGVAGFATQVGCMGRCSFCIEAGLPWKPRSPMAVVEELAVLRAQGCTELHLCDCEFNQDLDTAKEMLRQMEEAGLGLSWSLYMKPLPHDAKLFRMLAASGAASLTLSVDSASLAAGAYGLADLGSFIALARGEGIGVAVDLLVGFPAETLQGLRPLFDFFREAEPDTVGVSAGIRVFKYTELGKAMRERAPSEGSLEGGDPDFIRPAYFNLLSLEDCRELVGGDPLFRIEGLERRSNYERLS
ncbi:MAG: cobalamin-dependent protein [Actinomycetota bacterium]